MVIAHLSNVIHRGGYGNDFTDARGNVDRDSDEEEGQPEAFNPQYESLPALRPAQPPQYKPTPNYPHGGTAGVDYPHGGTAGVDF